MTGRHERSSAMPAGHCRPATGPGNDRTALMVQISTKFQTVLAGNDGVAGLSGPSLPVAGAITGTSCRAIDGRHRQPVWDNRSTG